MNYFSSFATLNALVLLPSVSISYSTAPPFLIEQIVASSRFKAQPPALHRELVSLALANLNVGRSPGGGDGVGVGSGSLARVA
jgi:hypothetical protein